MVVILLFLILIVLIVFMFFFIKDKFPIFFTNIIVCIKKIFVFLKKNFIDSFKSITTKTGIGAILFLIIYSYSKYRFFDYKWIIKWNEMRANTIFYDYNLQWLSIESLYLKSQKNDLKYILLSFLILILILIQIFFKKIRIIPLLPILFFLILWEGLYLGNIPGLIELIEIDIFKKNLSYEIYDKYIKLLRGFYAFIPISIGGLLSLKYLKTNRLNIVLIILGMVLIILPFVKIR